MRKKESVEVAEETCESLEGWPAVASRRFVKKRDLLGRVSWQKAVMEGWRSGSIRGELESRELYWERARGRCGVWNGSCCCTDCLHTKTWIWQQSRCLAEARQLLFLALPCSHLNHCHFLPWGRRADLATSRFSLKMTWRESRSGPWNKAGEGNAQASAGLVSDLSLSIWEKVKKERSHSQDLGPIQLSPHCLKIGLKGAINECSLAGCTFIQLFLQKLGGPIWFRMEFKQL